MSAIKQRMRPKKDVGQSTLARVANQRSKLGACNSLPKGNQSNVSWYISTYKLVKLQETGSEFSVSKSKTAIILINEFKNY